MTCEAAVLICGIYVDLNQLRAGEASSPADSLHSSAFNRIVSVMQQQAGDYDPQMSLDGWLGELTIDESADPNADEHMRSATGRRSRRI